MIDAIRMQRVWNYDENTSSIKTNSSGKSDIPMHKLKGDSKDTTVIKDIDVADNTVIREKYSSSSNLDNNDIEASLIEEAENELTKVLNNVWVLKKRCEIMSNR